MAEGNRGKKYNDVASNKQKCVDRDHDRNFLRAIPMFLTPESEAELDLLLGNVPVTIEGDENFDVETESEFDDDAADATDRLDAAMMFAGDNDA